MRVVKGLNGEIGGQRVAATIGVFDGVHLGHVDVIKALSVQAASRGLGVAIITFENHPRTLFDANTDLKMIMSVEDRVSKLASLGVDYTVLLAFDRGLSRLSAREFMQLIYDRYGVRLLMIGFNHRFGGNRVDGFDDYKRYGREIGVEVIRSEEYMLECASVSSSMIRSCIQRGDVAEAAHYMGANFKIEGVVVQGFMRGREIGFPTANIELSAPNQIIPKDGVYAVLVQLMDGSRYGGMINIGTRPTFDDGMQRSLEVNIFGFSGDIYSQHIQVEFIARMRDEVRMDSLDALVEQLNRDKQCAMELINKYI